MNHKIWGGLNRVVRIKDGYTLVEAIIGIAVCGFGLAAILSLYGMAIKTEMISKNIFEQSMEINSIADEINIGLQQTSSLTLEQRVNAVLENKYPDYHLESFEEHQHNLYLLNILHKGTSSGDKTFVIKVFWRPEL